MTDALTPGSLRAAAQAVVDEVGWPWSFNPELAFKLEALRTALAQPKGEPHPPSRQCMCPECAPSFDVPDTFKLRGESDDAWIDRITGASPQAGAAPSEFERGRQQGMEQERAMWQLAAEGQALGLWESRRDSTASAEAAPSPLTDEPEDLFRLAINYRTAPLEDARAAWLELEAAINRAIEARVLAAAAKGGV